MTQNKIGGIVQEKSETAKQEREVDELKIAYRDETGVVVVRDVNAFIFLEGKCYFETVDENYHSIDYCINVDQIFNIDK